MEVITINKSKQNLTNNVQYGWKNKAIPFYVSLMKKLHII